MNIPNNLISGVNLVEWSGLGTVNIGNQFNNNGCAECGSTCPSFSAGGTCNEALVCPTNFCDEIFGTGTPFFNAGPDQELCNIFTTTLAAEAGAGTWSTSTAGVVINDPMDPNSSVSNLTVGDNVFTWDVGGLTNDVVVTVYELPDQPSITSSTDACVGTNVVLQVQAADNVSFTYEWFKGGTTTGQMGDQIILLGIVENSGDYTVVATDVNTTCENTSAHPQYNL